MSKNVSLKDTGVSCDQIFASSDNPGQNIWNKIEKSCKNGQDRKSLISTFACFLTAFAKLASVQFEIFLEFATFLR